MSHEHAKFEFTVDGATHGTSDEVMDGDQIREAAGLVPASDFILIQIVDGAGRSIGLEDEVTFRRNEKATFLSARGDRLYTFTVNERRWEWGAATIAAESIYRYANIDDDLELVLDSAGDLVIPADGEVSLSDEGV